MDSTTALLVIDMQQDFLPGGSLAVPDGDAIIPRINELGRKFEHVILTQDWHPAGHISFASTHCRQPFVETVEASYGAQSLWPDHTIQGSTGADFPKALDLPHAEMIVRKGFRRAMDSYSAFLENDRRTPTGLSGYLKEKGIVHLFLCGLAWDYCVGYTALDAVRLGFEVTVVTDLVRGISPQSIMEMTERWLRCGVVLRESSAVQD